MPGPYTVDASVFLSAAHAHEIAHDDSLRFLAGVQAQGIPIIAPVLLLPEVGGAAGRASGDADLARRIVASIVSMAHLILVPLDDGLAALAADVAGQHRLRGSDAVYVAVAQRFGTPLVTLDREQRERAAALVAAQHPAEVRSQNG